MDVPDDERCQQYVDHRDSYRRTGRGSSGFEMHYNRERCKRRKPWGKQVCWQHQEGGRD